MVGAGVVDGRLKRYIFYCFGIKTVPSSAGDNSLGVVAHSIDVVVEQSILTLLLDLLLCNFHLFTPIKVFSYCCSTG